MTTPDVATLDTAAATSAARPSLGPVILIGGQMFAGKDTLANYLTRRLDELLPHYAPWSRKGFADEVKAVFCDTFGVSLEFVEKWKRVPTPPPGFLKPVRDCLIDIGDRFRQMRADVWIDKLDRKRGPAGLIVSDGRYLNEMRAVREWGGYTLTLCRPGTENTLDSESEQQLPRYLAELRVVGEGPLADDLVHYHLRNDSFTVADFKSKIDRTLLPLVVRYLRQRDSLAQHGRCSAYCSGACQAGKS